MPGQTVRHTRGFALMEVLLAISCVCLFLPLALAGWKLVTELPFTDAFLQDQIGIIQLRQIMVAADIRECFDDQVVFTLHGQQRQLRQVDRWLLVQPGTWIFATQVENVRFGCDTGVMMQLKTAAGSYAERLQ